MSRKQQRIAALVDEYRAHDLNRHYLGYLNCFNRQLFYEAHEVLEHIWLKDKHGPHGPFYKGLIQLAGAFVHLQRNHPRPAAALLKLALANLKQYSPQHESLDLDSLCRVIAQWLEKLEQSQFTINPLTAENAPRLNLLT